MGLSFLGLGSQLLGAESFRSSGSDCLGAGVLIGLPVIGTQQEELELPGAYWMILPMAIDTNGSPAALVRIVKELGSSL